MSFPVPSFDRIRADLLRDLKNYRPDADVTVDSDFYVRATSIASAVEGLYQHQAWIVRQIFPDTADSEYLYMHAAVRGLRLKKAVSAHGQIKLTAPAGTVIPDGLRAKREDGKWYAVVGEHEVGADGEAIVPAAAVEAGPQANAVDGTAVVLHDAPVGVESNAVLIGMLGGTKDETDTELLARLLEIIRRPPAGGNRHDFRRWAMEVDGVTDAFVYPLRRGLGTVDIAVVSDNALPSEHTLQAVRDHIDDVRPVTAKGVLVVAPTIRTVDIVAEVQAISLDDAKVDINATLLGQFTLIPPGSAWIRSHAEAGVSNVSGVQDRRILVPSANVIPIVDAHTIEWLRPGSIVLEEML